MGNKQSKNEQQTKNDKVVNDEKLLKIGVGFGRGDLRVEGNFQMGWHRRCNKKYTKCERDPDPDRQPLVQNMEEQEPDE